MSDKGRVLELTRRYVAPHRVDVWEAFETQLVMGRRDGYRPATYGFPIVPDGYLEGIRDLCDRHGALYIADEVQTFKPGLLMDDETVDAVLDRLELALARASDVDRPVPRRHAVASDARR